MTSNFPTLDSAAGPRGDDRIDLTNQIVNGYRVLHRLGAGGMADVYLAFHEQLQRHVALKVMRADLSASKDHIQRFLQEARSAASLIHPNIVQVYDIGTWGKIHYIAQEYIAGNTLRSFIHRRGSLSQPEVLSIMLQIAAALQKASSIGVVHRDIKPDNVLLTPDGEVKVADFGLARVRSQTNGLTEIGVALGTPTYMSPEQIQGQSVDARSDLYSLGATAYEMLSGRPPFEGETALALALQHLQNPAPDLKSLRPDVDDELVDIIKRLLSKAADDRFGSAAELTRSIKKMAERLSIKTSLDHPIPFSGILLDQVPVIGPQTTHLQSAAIANAAKGKRSWFRRVLIPLLAIFVGILVTGITQNLGARSLVRQPTLRGAEAVKTESDIKKQFFKALMSNKPIDWRAIESKFPPDRSDPINISFNLKAWLHYAWFCLDYDRPKEADEAADKILQYVSPEDNVIRALAFLVKGMVALNQKDQTEFQRRFREAKQIYDGLPKVDQDLIWDAMPWSTRGQWYLPEMQNN
jgi:eukaryotic-like serine/threonine-protein kinase